MTSTIMVEVRFWTAKRIAGCAAALVGLTIGMPILVGFSAAHLAKIDPGHDWRGMTRIAVLILFSVGVVGGLALLWRSYGRHVARGADEPWAQRAAAKRVKISAIWRDAALVGMVVGFAMAMAAVAPAGPIRIALAVLVCAAISYGVVRSTVQYMRAIDEQERDANLWAAYVGITVYFVLFFGQHLAARFGIVTPHAHDAIFLITLCVVGVTFLWKRCR